MRYFTLLSIVPCWVCTFAQGDDWVPSGRPMLQLPSECSDTLEPNQTPLQFALLASPASFEAKLDTPTSIDLHPLDGYRFQVDQTSHIAVSVIDPTKQASLELRKATEPFGSLGYGSMIDESRTVHNVTPGTYMLEVARGFWDPPGSGDPCYRLMLEVVATSICPTALWVYPVTVHPTSATVIWTMATAQAPLGELRWRKTGSADWTYGYGSNGLSIGSLTERTPYEVQLRKRCGSNGNFTYSKYDHHAFTTPPCDASNTVRLAPRMWLDGATRTDSALMGDELRRSSLIPLQEPYGAMGHQLTGRRSTTSSVLEVMGHDAIVDWVVVELRRAQAPHTVVEAKAALLQRDGDVVAVDGVSDLGFCAPAGAYRVSVRHRNHLGVMTANALSLSGTATAVDLSAPGTQVYGTNARRAIDGVMALWSGNVISDAFLRYTGLENDREPMLQAINGVVPTNTYFGYHPADVTLDGFVRYVGTGNDRDIILRNIGGAVPTNILQQQLP